MARFNFRQGIARRQEDGLGNPTFLLPTSGGAFIDLIVSPDPTNFLIAHFDIDYRVSENATVTRAWGSFTSGQDYWLYWDVDFVTGELTRDFTLYEPVNAASPPSSPVADQHWFDLTVNVMKVWSGAGWVEKIRVFAAQYMNGSTLIHYPLGSQVGLDNIPIFAGAILFDPDGNPLQKFQRNRRGQFITTETDMNSQFTRIANFRVEAAVVQGEAEENIPISHAITYSDYDKLSLARNAVPSKPAIGISLEAMVTGEVRSYLTKGFVTNDVDFDFSAFPAGTPLFVGPTGELITTPPTSPSIQQVAIIVNKNTIFVDVQQLINLTTAGNLIPVQIDRDTGIFFADDINVGAFILNELQDVALGSPLVDGEVLMYDGITGMWTNAAPVGGGGSPVAGGMVTGISLNSGANVNSANRSILNFIEGSNRVDLTITDNAINDRVNIFVDVVEANLLITESQITDLGTYAGSAITLSAGTGMTGGGDLTANRIFNVNGVNSIVANATTIQLSGDVGAPGPNQVYGTDGAGTKGWKVDPISGGSPSAPIGSFDVFGYEHIEAGSPAPTTWTIAHGLNTRRVMTQIFETTGSPEGFDQIIPNSVRIVDANTVEVTFGGAQAGRAYLSLFR